MKTVYIVLAFHAHEPLWDLPRRLQRSAGDRRITAGVTPESWVRRRLKEGRNVYRDLLALAADLEAPLSIDLTNELCTQLRRHVPATYRALARGFAEGRLRPVYTAAHHAHAVLLTREELADELRLGEEMLEGTLGVRRPERPGVFFTECSVTAEAIRVAEAMGFFWAFVPELDPARVPHRTVPAGADAAHGPLRIGRTLLGLPRTFGISQEIWRPITRRAAGVKYQGFLLDDGPVFSDDYRAGRPSTSAPPDPDGGRDPAGPSAVAEYAPVWRDAIARAPDGGLLVYLQDLELMDFGETALRLLHGALDAVRAEAGATLRFVAPDEYLATALGDGRRIPTVHFRQASWAPELRPALRSDGHYPPRGAGRYRGVDADREIFRRRPFVFWEPGRFTAALFGWLLDRFGYARTIPADAVVLADEEYRLDRFPERVRLPLLYRLTKRACNWGWYPEEGMIKRTFLKGYLLADALALELRLRRDEGPELPVDAPLPAIALPGIARLPEILLDARLDYLRFGLERWREERGGDPEAALVELAAARAERRQAHEEALKAQLAYQLLAARPGADAWRELLLRVREYCRAMFLALDHLQRAWGKADAEFLIVPMYRFLADLYPPRGPDILDEVEAEAARIESERVSGEHGPAPPTLQ